MKEKERRMDEAGAWSVWTRLTRGWKECTLEMADGADEESTTMR